MPLAKVQRGDPCAFANGLLDMFAGDETDDADAAAYNLARVLLLLANGQTNNEFTKG